MTDQPATSRGFHADEPLAAAPDPWDHLPMPVVREGPPWAMAEMIAAEPGVVARVGLRVVEDGSGAALADSVRAAAEAGGPIIVTGCGTSEHAAMGVAAILGEAWRDGGLPGHGPVAAQAFELALEPPSGGLVIGISHEGGTTATISAVDAARARGSRTAVITGSAASPAALAADVVVQTVEMDRSWCHTVGYVSPLAAAAVTAELLAGRVPAPALAGELLRRGADAASAAGSDGTSPADAIGASIGEAAHLLVVASGVDRIAARELVLKVEEAAWVPSAMRDLETFLHGHLPATGASTALVVILTEATAIEERAKRLRQALAAAAATGVRAGAILSTSAAALVPATLTPAGRVVVPETSSALPVVASLMGTAGPLQLITLGVAAARGTNPDPIRRDDPVYLRAAELADDPSI